MDIIVEHNPERAQLDALGVFDWPVTMSSSRPA